jgi:hypothetical protein
MMTMGHRFTRSPISEIPTFITEWTVPGPGPDMNIEKQTKMRLSRSYSHN